MTAKYADRLAKSAEALQVLTLHPDGLSIDDLAKVLGMDVYDTRQNLASYHDGQFLVDESGVSPLLLAREAPPPNWDGISRDDWFFDHEAPDMESGVWVALDRDISATDPFGVMLEVSQIVELLICADHLMAQEPENEDLRSAIDVLRVKWVPEMSTAGQTFPTSPTLPLIRRAIVEQRKLRFTYSREWEPGTSTRVVDPYVLRHTHLGYELDAGPVADNGRIRTYLVRNISDPQLLDETFEEPRDKDRLIRRNRQTVTFRIVIPEDANPSFEALTADIEVPPKRTTRAPGAEVLVTLQQPFEDRLAMLMFRLGPGAILVEDIALMNRSEFADYRTATARKARELLTHHGLV